MRRMRVVVAGLALVGAVGLLLLPLARPNDSTRDEPAEAAERVTSPWVNPDSGRFQTYKWDTRELPEAEKAAQPWYDPRWKPFSDCMVAAGYDVREDPGVPFGQSDFDRIVDLANVERPDGRANLVAMAGSHPLGGIAGAFVWCGDTWLTLKTSEWEQHGLTKLEPGEVPEP